MIKHPKSPFGNPRCLARYSDLHATEPSQLDLHQLLGLGFLEFSRIPPLALGAPLCAVTNKGDERSDGSILDGEPSADWREVTREDSAGRER